MQKRVHGAFVGDVMYLGKRDGVEALSQRASPFVRYELGLKSVLTFQ